MILSLAQNRISEYANITTVHPIGLTALVLLGIFTFLIPRRHALLPLLVLLCFIPGAQRIVLGGLDLTFIRLLIFVGCIRLLLRGEYTGLRWMATDSLMIAWTIVSITVFTIQQLDHSAGFTFRAGVAVDTLGGYFFCRATIRTWSQLVRSFRVLAFLAVPVAALFLVEMSTQRNLLAVFGGVPEITAIREGRLRCQGAFAHPILAGCFWASLFPIFVSLGRARGFLSIYSVASCCALIGVLASGSSTPAMAVIFAAVGLCFYPLRFWMRHIQLAILFTAIALHVVMKGPVWSLIAKVNVFSGSTGYHRFLLIDAAIRHFGEWWLVGLPSTEHWGWFMTDVANEYVLEAVRGGIWSLSLFVAMIVMSFLYIGRWVRTLEGHRDTIIAWGLGVSVFVHCTSFIGVSYFGQLILLWNLTLAFATVSGTLAAGVEADRARRRVHRSAAAARAGTAVKDADSGAIAPMPRR